MENEKSRSITLRVLEHGKSPAVPRVRNGSKREKAAAGRSLRARVLSRIFSEDYAAARRARVLDPRGDAVRRWSRAFLSACLASLFIDPLFLYLPEAKPEMCIRIGAPLEIGLTLFRSALDVFYGVNIYIRFRTAFVAPSSRIFGRGELVIDPSKIAARYLCGGFCLHLLAALPLPQLLIWVVVPSLGSSVSANTSTKNIMRFILMAQYPPRLYLIVPLTTQIVNDTGVMTVKPWAGAFYNLVLYTLASHVLGACWYSLSMNRWEACWRSVCEREGTVCQGRFFDCRKDGAEDPIRDAWFRSSNVAGLCSPSRGFYRFGIYGDAVAAGVTSSSSPFFNKYFYCLWWGLKNLSSLGQTLSTGTYIGEIVFAILIAIVGLVLFALLIGNMQRILQSTTARLEEWRIKRSDTEQWMRHRQLPQELREAVRKYDQYKWVTTRGVDEEALLRGLPMDLRRCIKRHLCLDLVRRVPLFDSMDERTLDAICERLKPALSTPGRFLVREGDPVNEMLFIIRGRLDSYTTNGGRTGFFESCRIGPGDFCGEELLTWALDPRPPVVLPYSTRTVHAVSEVEAFALSARHLKFVASQFHRLHTKHLRHKLRFYSHQWRTWAACFVQSAWRRYKKRRDAAELRCLAGAESCGEWRREPTAAEPETGTAPVCYGGRQAASSRNRGSEPSGAGAAVLGSLRKPAEPDFSGDEDCF